MSSWSAVLNIRRQGQDNGEAGGVSRSPQRRRGTEKEEEMPPGPGEGVSRLPAKQKRWTARREGPGARRWSGKVIDRRGRSRHRERVLPAPPASPVVPSSHPLPYPVPRTSTPRCSAPRPPWHHPRHCRSAPCPSPHPPPQRPCPSQRPALQRAPEPGGGAGRGGGFERVISAEPQRGSETPRSQPRGTRRPHGPRPPPRRSPPAARLRGPTGRHRRWPRLPGARRARGEPRPRGAAARERAARGPRGEPRGAGRPPAGKTPRPPDRAPGTPGLCSRRSPPVLEAQGAPGARQARRRGQGPTLTWRPF